MNDPKTVDCPSCGEGVGPADAFCESCGAALGPRPGLPQSSVATAPSGCSACGSPIDDLGYCTACGHKQRTWRDHVEIDLGDRAGGVSDRGRHHFRNEDAMAIGIHADGAIVAVVCDGVSNSPRSDEAAQSAVASALTAALDALTEGESALSALEAAAGAGQAAVASMESDPSRAPSCTFVACVVRGIEITVGCVGDSRAYLVVDGEARALTRDDSWAAEVVERGERTEVEASQDARAHQITRWLGVDTPSAAPRLCSVSSGSNGCVILCSDGLWNEVAPASAIFELVDQPKGRPPLAVAQDLCRAANEAGGRDNITVVVVPMPNPGGPS